MKKVIILLSLLIVSSCGIRKMPTNFFSKEMCSCLFIEMQSEKYCKNYLDISLPVWGYEIDTKLKQVYSQGYFSTATAKLKNRMLGCQLSK